MIYYCLLSSLSLIQSCNLIAFYRFKQTFKDFIFLFLRAHILKQDYIDCEHHSKMVEIGHY